MNEMWLLGAALLLIVSVLSSKITSRFGIPSLIFFLGIGMLAGSEGIGKIRFENPSIAKWVGIVSLCLILFSGGMDTSWQHTKKIFVRGILLSTVGVLISTALAAWFAVTFLHISWLEGLLLGAVISCTDAAAVFSLLRANNIHLKRDVTAILEFESGSNDPMAVVLMLGLLRLITEPDTSIASLIPMFLKQMILGGCIGIAGGRLLQLLINRLRLEVEGLYLVLTVGWIGFMFGVTEWVGGNGFLAVYLAGIVLGNSNFLRKKTVVVFHDGLAWLMQIAMFLTLGLLVFPSKFQPVAGNGVALALFLVFVARPVSVFVALFRSRFSWREQLFIAWTGLRGAVPIILATYPWTKSIPAAEKIFHLVFFVVLVSVLIQGSTVAYLAKILKLGKDFVKNRRFSAKYQTDQDIRNTLALVTVEKDSFLDGKSLLELGNFFEMLVVSIQRERDIIVPRGSTRLEATDLLYVLADQATISVVQQKSKTGSR